MMCLLIGENERKRSNVGIETLGQKKSERYGEKRRERERERERERKNERR
jgi:hypothetical protein